MDKVLSSEIPNKPGIYIFKDKDGNPLYVGKAKNIRKRVGNYFNNNSSWKVKRLTNEATDISFLVSQSESDALLAEYSFIQEYKPKYNIQFKDDKSYPYITITSHKWPRAMVTRTLNYNNTNFGPFPFVGAARRSLDHLINIYLYLLLLNQNYFLKVIFFINENGGLGAVTLGPREKFMVRGF